jgi:hypothetical protein
LFFEGSVNSFLMGSIVAAASVGTFVGAFAGAVD